MREHDARARSFDPAASLNQAQRRAATAEPGPHLVVAGAGTGKTRTLVYRVAHLVASGAAPEQILLLTFTRRAADEMLRRAAALLDARCRRVAGGTFHSFANQVLRRHARRVGFDEGFTILDASDAGDLVGLVRTEGGFAKTGRRFPRKETLAALISKRTNTGRSLADLLSSELPQHASDEPAIEKLAARYCETKRAQNVMDYDDLLVHLRTLLTEHAAVRRQLGNHFRHLLVDEYQDTNRLQAHITALLATATGSVMVVGDEAQSIYGFRGADFRNIIDFTRLFPQATITKLEQNYRSTQPILDLANALLAGAREGFGKQLRSEITGDARPQLVRTEDEHDQARFVAERVLTLREQGVALSDMAVLVRAAWHTNALELALAERNIPFRKFGGQRFLEAAHIKDVLALLRLAANPRDATAWFRVLQWAEGVGPATAQRLGQAVVDAGGDLAPLRAAMAARQRFGRQVARIAGMVENLGRQDLDLAERLEHALGAYRRLMPEDDEHAEHRTRDLEALPVIAGRYDDLESFLGALAIEPAEQLKVTGDDPEDELLVLSTVHSAKGLEWHSVFVLGMVEGMFPNRAARDADAFEEERRLLYVAITRCRRQLFLLRPETLAQRSGWGHRLIAISPLLAELDLAALVEELPYQPAREPDADADADRSQRKDAPGDEALRRIQAYFGDG